MRTRLLAVATGLHSVTFAKSILRDASILIAETTK